MMPDVLQYGNVQPSDMYTEELVLCECLSYPTSFEKAIVNLNTEDFYYPDHELIFGAMIRLYVNSIKPDVFTVITNLRENNEIEKIGGSQKVLAVASKFVGSSNIEYHVKKIKELSLKRKLITLAIDTTRKAFDEGNGFDILNSMALNIEMLQANMQPKTVETWSDTMREVAKSIISNDGQLGLSTGFKSLDTLIGGMLPGELIILAAGPGEGKTTFALNIGKYVSENIGGVIVFSLEMSKTELALKNFSYETENTIKSIRSNQVDLHKVLVDSKVMNAQMFVYDQNIDSVHDIVNITKSELKDKNLKLVIVDYLQLVPGGDSKKFGTREQEISFVSRTLKKMAKDIGLPVIALSQVSRQKGRSSYQLSDLRESGAIEQDANIVIFAWRPQAHGHGFYVIDGETQEVEDNAAFIKIAKSRLGELAEFKMLFEGKASKFIEAQTETVFNEPTSFTEPTKQPDDGLPF